MQASNLRRGMFVNYQNHIHEVIDFQHSTPGNKRAFVQLKVKDILTGKIVTSKFSATDDVDLVYLDSRPSLFLYKDHEGFHFMDMNDYHTFTFNEGTIGDDAYFLIENMELAVMFNNEQPVKLELPRNIVMEVTESEPGIKGDSVSNNTKPVTLATGLKIQAPLFINQGDRIKIDTTEKKYLSRE